jgi:N-acetylglucosamine kinase-like BadF-type ATPase
MRLCSAIVIMALHQHESTHVPTLLFLPAAGSGTVTFGMADGKTQAKSAGWGPVFMDGGSGFDLANRGLSAMCKAYDGRGASTMLLEVSMKQAAVLVP